MTPETTTWTKIAIAGGVLCGVGELALSPTMDFPSGTIAAIVFGVAFLAGVARLRRSHVSGAWVITVLAAVELAFVPMYPRSSAWDWASQGSFTVVSIVAFVGGIGVIAQSRRRKRVAASVPA